MHELAENKNYDAIVIGSGLGGLATAAFLAKIKNLRVLVLERHYVPGGFTHSFKRPGGFEWDVGVHYVGLMGPGYKERALFDFVTDGNLDWQRMPEPVDVLDYPDLQIPLYSDENVQRRQLIKLFPREKAAILNYYRDLKIAERWGIMNFIAGTLPRPVSALIRLILKRAGKLALLTTEQYIEQSFNDPKLKAVVSSQWLAYGLTPSQSAFGLHAAVVRHYFKGGYFPKGGAGQIAKTIIDVIKSSGGDVKINHEVARIVMDGNKAVGVEVKTREKGADCLQTIYAPAIISDAGIGNTFSKFLAPETAGLTHERLSELCKAPSAVSLYLGLKKSPATLGFKGENHWIFPGFDHEDNVAGGELLNGIAPAGHLSFPSLKGNQQSKHTAEFFSVIDIEKFSQWQGGQWKKRGESYNKLKQNITTTMLDLIEARHPGFQDLVEYSELSTPLSVQHFMDHPNGAIYGLPGTPDKFRQNWLKAKSPIPNLYLTGADLLCVGIVPALLSGAATAGAIMGPFGFLKVMLAATRRKKDAEPIEPNHQIAGATTQKDAV